MIDASALAEVVARTARAAGLEQCFEGEDLIAPDLINAQVLAVLRNWAGRKLLDKEQAQRSVRNLSVAPVRRFTTSPFIDEIWKLRHHVTPYDGAYVILARRTRSPLLSLDDRLRRAPGLGVALLPGRPT